MKYVLIFSTIFVWNISRLRRFQHDAVINVQYNLKYLKMRWGNSLPVLQTPLGHFASSSPDCTGALCFFFSKQYRYPLSSWQHSLLRTNPAFDMASYHLSYRGQGSEMGDCTYATADYRMQLVVLCVSCNFESSSGATRGEFGGFNPPPPKFRRRPSKIVRNPTRLWKMLKIAEFGTPTPQDVRKKGSEILKLPPVRNCFTLAMTNKLVVIINSLKVPKIKKILLYEMKFHVPNYSCLQNPWLGGTAPRSPFSLSSVLRWICWTPPEQNSWVRHCTGSYVTQ